MGSSATPLNHMTRVTVLPGEEVVLHGRDTLRPMLPSTSTGSDSASNKYYHLSNQIQDYMASIKVCCNIYCKIVCCKQRNNAIIERVYGIIIAAVCILCFD